MTAERIGMQRFAPLSGMPHVCGHDSIAQTGGHAVESQYVDAGDGRRIAVSVFGPEWGVPVAAIGGNPSSRNGPHPTNEWLETLGVRLYAIDRAGLGDSDFRPDIPVADNVPDIQAVMKGHYGLGRFGMIARSGGTPAAEAYAALRGDELSALALTCALAPSDALPNWDEGMTQDNQQLYEDAAQSPEDLTAAMRTIAEMLRENPYAHLSHLWKQLAPADYIALMSSCALEGLVALGQAKGAGQTGEGWAAHAASIRKWQTTDFDISGIQVPTLIWHGTQDPFAPPSHSEWLHQQIERSHHIEDPNGSHFTALTFAFNALLFIRNTHIGPRRAELIQSLFTQRLAEIYGPGVNPPQADSSRGLIRALDTDRRRSLADIAAVPNMTVIRRIVMTPDKIYREVVREVITAPDQRVDELSASLVQ